MLAPIRAGSLGKARPLSISFGGRGGERSYALRVWSDQGRCKGSWITRPQRPSWPVWLLSGLSRLGLYLLLRCEPYDPLSNRCLEIPCGYNPDTYSNPLNIKLEPSTLMISTSSTPIMHLKPRSHNWATDNRLKSQLSRPDSGSLSVRSDPLTFQSLFFSDWTHQVSSDLTRRCVRSLPLLSARAPTTWPDASGLATPSSVRSLNQSYALCVAYDRT
jgi:hypothetical protein